MKIFHIITGLGNGGAEAVLYRLVTNDPADTHHVLSLTDAGKYGALLADAGVAVTTLNMPRGRVTPGGVMRLWRTLREARPDVVQTWMYHADLIGGVTARLAGVKRVFWGIHNTTLDPGKSKRSTIMVAKACAWLSRWVPRGIVCCAYKSLEVHQRLGYAVRKMVVIPNGYDLMRFAPDANARIELRAEWRIDEETPLLGMVGRFDPFKDHQNLISALTELLVSGRQFVAVLVGAGMTEENVALANWIATAGLTARVRLLGPRSDIPAVMNALDIHILSSAAEAFPNVLAEAMACGTPCVTTDVGDAARIVGDAGWVVPPHEPHALAVDLIAALEALDDTPRWHERQRHARQRICDEFGIDRMVRRYRIVWRNAAEGKKLATA